MTTTNHKTLADIIEALNFYKENYRRQGLPPLEISGLHSLFPEIEMLPEVTSKWPETWPFGERKGVYFILGSQGRLLYVGKASMHNLLAARLSSYFQNARPGDGCKIVQPSKWSEQPRFFVTLAVPNDMAFEAPALEEFLISRLSPPDNVNG